MGTCALILSKTLALYKSFTYLLTYINYKIAGSEHGQFISSYAHVTAHKRYK